jgi:hypothetical protein
MNPLKSGTGRRAVLLLIASSLLSVALSLPTARPASAAVPHCPLGCTATYYTAYYTDSTYSTVYCHVSDCYDDTCNGATTPYSRSSYQCCCQ